MTGKEIFFDSIHFKPVPRIPVTILDGYVWILNREHISFKDLINSEDYGESYITKAYDEFNTDNICGNAHSINIIFRLMGGTICYDRPGEAFEVTHPPLKNVSDIYQYSLDDLFEKAMQDSEFMSGLNLITGLKNYYKNERVIMGLVCAPFTFAGMMLGVQNFMEQIYDDEDATEALLAFATEAIIRFCKLLFDYGADTVVIADPVASGDMISPSLFEDLVLPTLQSVTKAFDPSTAPIMLHICGHTSVRLKPLKNSGIKAFSMDSIDIKEGLMTVDKTYALMGNMNPYDIMQSMTSDQVFDHCKTLASEAGLTGGYIMMPGCDLPPAVSLENIHAMVSAAHNTDR